jgi:hypothetical protein
MSTIAQRSFSGGELAPALYARVDTAKYASGLRTMRNFMLMRHGGAANRPGTAFVGEVKDSSKTVRLIPFIFNSDQTYVLEFGNEYMRVIRNGSYVLETSQAITGITNANPGVLTYGGADNYTAGDHVVISGVVGPIANYVNGRTFRVGTVTSGSNTFDLLNLDGTNFNTTSLGAYTSGGTVEEVYTITTPYLEAHLDDIQIAQSGDTLTLVHPSYAPRELSRTGHAAWTLATITFLPTIGAPTAVTATYSGGAGTLASHYVVTAVDAETGEESLVGSGLTGVITGISQANPGVVTVTGHSFQTNDLVELDGIVGMTELNGLIFSIGTTTANSFQLRKPDNSAGYNTTALTAYSSGGTVTQVGDTVSGHLTLSTSNEVIVSWTAVSGASEYVIYKEAVKGSSRFDGVYGFLGVSKTTSFNDLGVDPDLADTPPIKRNPFNSTDNYPSAVTYYQQRRGFANTNNDPEKVWFTRAGSFKNLTIRSPIQDDDAITFTLAGKQVNEVRHLLDIGTLIVLTSGGEWACEGDAGGALLPGAINPQQYTYNGSSALPPLVIGGNALYVQARGSVVRDLAFENEAQGYRGNDLTVFSAHMFDGYTLTDWTFQQIPHSVVWCVRDDGTLLGLTYVREHEMWGWHRHDTDGTFENVCSIPEGDEDALYVVIKRTIGGATKRYVERFTQRRVDDIEDSIFMDSSLSYDGRHDGATTMTLSEYSAGGWLYTSTLELTASASTFASTDVGNQIHLTGTDGTKIRFTIDTYVSATVVRGRPNKTVPAGMQATPIATWAMAVDQVTGLWHLEGQAVSVFGDGFVVACPNNDSYTAVTVTNGAITLDDCYAVIHIGLPYLSDIQTLDLDTSDGESIADKKKIVTKVTTFVEKSRGLWAGPKPPTDDDDDPKEFLVEYKLRNDEDYDSPPDLTTDTISVNIKPEWNSNGRVFLRQIDPLPLSVLAVVPSGLFPFRS